MQLDVIALATLALLGVLALAALAVLLADAERLPRLVRAGLESLFGQARLAELSRCKRRERRVLSGALDALRARRRFRRIAGAASLLARQPALPARARPLAGGWARFTPAGLRRGLLRRDIAAPRNTSSVHRAPAPGSQCTPVGRPSAPTSTRRQRAGRTVSRHARRHGSDPIAGRANGRALG
jgi:hypothetical protein